MVAASAESGGGKIGRRHVAAFLEHPAWVLATIFGLINARMAGAQVPGQYDADCWWVAAAGREMLRTGRIPTENGFSFVDGAQPWIMHEWLLGPLFASGIAKLGPQFLSLVAIVVATTTLSVAFASIARESETALSAWISGILLVTGYMDRFVSARPTGLSLVFPVLILALTLRQSFRLREIISAALVMLVWTNAHGSFPFGLFILGCGVLSPQGRPARITALVLGAVATLANPYGLRLHRFVFHYLAGDEPAVAVVHGWIREFSPLWRARDWVSVHVVVAFLGITTLIAFGLADRRTRLRTLGCVPILLLAVWNVRHLELAGFCCLMLLVPATNALARRLGAHAAPAHWFRWLPLAGGAFAFATWSVRAIRHPQDDTLLGGYRVAIPLIDALPDGAHVFTPFATAPVVTWFAYPRGVLTYADPRNDCFRASTLETFLEVESGLGPAELGQVLAASTTTHVLMPDGNSPAVTMEHLAGWRPLVRADSWTLYVRADPSATEPRP